MDIIISGYGIAITTLMPDLIQINVTKITVPKGTAILIFAT